MSETLSHDAFLKAVKYDDKGLVPTIAQSAATGEVLMLAWMSAATLAAETEIITRAQTIAAYVDADPEFPWARDEHARRHDLVAKTARAQRELARRNRLAACRSCRHDQPRSPHGEHKGQHRLRALEVDGPGRPAERRRERRDARGNLVGWRRSGQGDAEFGQLGFDAAHGEKLWTEPVSSASASLVSE
jgi:hypothetical protein